MSDHELERVKQILVGDVKVALNSVTEELDRKFDKEEFARAVSEVLAEALEERTGSDDRVADVLAPTIDQAISGSINQDPKKLAESLYPIMGPAIRKSISETIQQMLENFNQLLEQSFSPKFLLWRFTAWRTGRSYSELVMLNTLEYRIEQVFLIHRETSLLVQHQLSDQVDAKDPDMVSSMFSAIQDFIEDSFSTDETNELNTLRLGDLTVLIQRGPAAVLAAVVRGRTPANLRPDMIELLESLHIKKRAQLADYSGDPDDFLDVEPQVRKLLQSERKDLETKKFPWPAVGAIVLAVIGLGIWHWLGVQLIGEQKREVALLASQPGIVVLEAKHSRSHLDVELMADPDAIDPMTILSMDHPEYSVQTKVIPYLSIEPEVLERRANRIINPQSGTELSLDGRVIVLTGSANVNWLKEAEIRWPSVSGAEGIDSSALTRLDPELDAIQSLSGQIESIVFQFETGSAELDPESPGFVMLVADLNALLSRTAAYGLNVAIDIVGFTDSTGTEQVNRIIALNRAETLKLYLMDAGFPEDLFSTHRGQDYSGIDKDDTSSIRETHLVVRTMP